MKLWSHYHIPHTVEEALTLLAQYDGRAQLLAGGTDLLIDIQQGNHPPAEALIDITKIKAINTIDIVEENGTQFVYIGAAVTHSAIVATPAIRHRATCLAESCGVVGGPQVRNVATIGGNVVHALPAADGTLSLVALDAVAEVASVDGRHMYPITATFVRPGQSIVDPTRQLMTRFKVRLALPGEASAFKRIMRPQGVALPILGCAVWLRLDASRQQIEAAAICLGPVSPTPQRATEIEQALIGQPAQAAVMVNVAALAKQTLHPRASKYRATAEYRSDMIELLVRQSLQLALSRAVAGEAVLEGME